MLILSNPAILSPLERTILIFELLCVSDKDTNQNNKSPSASRFILACRLLNQFANQLLGGN
jgi:hypothetical protein